MKKLLGLVVLSVLTGSLAGASAAYYQYGSWRDQHHFSKPLAWANQNPASGPEAPGEAQPLRARAFVEGDAVHDFGVMSRNEKRSHTFTVSNRGNAPLSLRFVDKSCQCTEVAVSKSEIEPNGSSQVTLTWQPSTNRPDFQQSARFQTNDPARVELDLTIKGRVQQIVEVVPPAVSLDGVVAGQAQETSIDLVGYREQPLAASRVEFLDTATASFFEADIQPMAPDAVKLIPHAVSGSRITIRVRPGLSIGRFQQQMRIFTDQSDLEPLDVPIQGTVNGNVTFVGPGYDSRAGIWRVGKLSGSQETTKNLWLIFKGNDSADLQVRVASVDPAEILAVELPNASKTDKLVKQGLTVKFKPVGRVVNRQGTADGPIARIVLETNHPDIPRVEIPVAFALEAGTP